jgi:hypothetical protein
MQFTMNNSIAVIGLSGSGKTVLMAALTKQMSSIDKHGIYLEPLTFRTTKFMEKVASTIAAGHWPTSTPQGELQDYEWRLHLPDAIFVMKSVDLAGQDLADLFDDDKIRQQERLFPSQLRILDQFKDAPIVLFLIDIEEFYRRTETSASQQATLKAAIDFLCEDSRRKVCLVLPKADLHQVQKDKYGGWPGMLKEFLPYIYYPYIQTQRLKVIPVSAVANTQAMPDGSGGYVRLPTAGMPTNSFGIADLAEWIKASAAAWLRDFELAPPTSEQEESQEVPIWIGWLLVLILFMAVVAGVKSWDNARAEKDPSTATETFRPGPAAGRVDEWNGAAPRNWGAEKTFNGEPPP